MKKQNILWGIIILIILGIVMGLGITLPTEKQAEIIQQETTTSATQVSEGPSIQNPLTLDANKKIQVYSDFVLDWDAPASTNVLDCFGTTLEDLQARYAWSSSESAEGTFCNMVFDENTKNGLPIQVIKEYSIPGSFQIIKTPYLTGIFGEIELQKGASYAIKEKVSYSGGDIITGGFIADQESTLQDQFGVPASEQLVTISVHEIDRTWSNEEKSYDSCISFSSHYSSISLPYGLYEHIWCEIEPKEYALVARELIQN